jgi:biopolymer transport protein ExbD
VKAQISLPERPSALYLLAVLDLLVVLLIFFALIPAVAEQAGMPLNRMKFSSRMDTIPPGKRVSLFGRGGPQPRFHLGRNQIELEDLAVELSRLKEERAIEVLVAVLDEDMRFGLVSELEKVADQVGIEVILGGRLEMEKTGFRNLREDSPESEAREDQDGAEE